MFCSKCGAQNGGGNAFCVSCGAPLMNNAPSPQQPPQSQQPPMNQAYYAPNPNANYAPQGYNQPQPGYYPQAGYGQPVTVKKQSNTVIGIVVVVVIVVILAVAAYFIFFSGGSPVAGTWTGSEAGSDISITFKNGGVVTGVIAGENLESKYAIQGNNLTITDSDGSVYKYTYKITAAGGKTVLTLDSDDGQELSLTKK